MFEAAEYRYDFPVFRKNFEVMFICPADFRLFIRDYFGRQIEGPHLLDHTGIDLDRSRCESLARPVFRRLNQFFSLTL
jgi:hypothetical protein